MYARLRMKQLYAIPGTTLATATAEGTKTLSVMCKQIAKLLTGQITSTSQLNVEVWDIPNCEIIATVGAGYTEYQTTYLSSATDIPVTNPNQIYLRASAQGQTFNGQPVYKYVAVGPNGIGAGVQSINISPVIDVPSYTGNPTLTWSLARNISVSGNRFYFGAGICTGAAGTPSLNLQSEIIISASPYGIFVSASAPLRNAQPYFASWILDHAPTVIASNYAIPCIAFSKTFTNWDFQYAPTFSASTSSLTGSATGSTLSAFYLQSGTSQTLPSGFGLFKNAVDDNAEANIFAVATPTVYPGSLGTVGWTSLHNNTTVNSDTNLSTLKPNGYSTTMSNMLDASGNAMSFPMLPLWYWPVWDTFMDLSTNSGVYMTKTGLGASGDDITINGTPYAYINTSPVGYLIPKR